MAAGVAGVKIRPSGTRYAHVLTEECLKKLYVERGRTAARSARKFGCNTGTVYNWLREHGIPLMRKRGRT